MADLGLMRGAAWRALRNAMDLGAMRQRVYAGNIAHGTNPGYKRKDVAFSDEMKRASGAERMKTTHPGHRTSGSTNRARPEVVEKDEPVDIEKESVALADNQMRFNLAARVAALRIQSLRSSIRGS